MILHVYGLDKFVPGFISFLEENFPSDQHQHFIIGDESKYPLPKIHGKAYRYEGSGTRTNRLKLYSQLALKLHAADKVILHGLFNTRVVQILYSMPWLLKKCYWVIWGGDLYRYSLGNKDKAWERLEHYRRPVIRGMGNLISYVPGDVAVTREWYGAKGNYHECIMYPSNTFFSQEHPSERKKSDVTRILVGNSADPSNNHYEMFDLLKKSHSDCFELFCPLSYGDKRYAEAVAATGTELFGTRFFPMFEFLPVDSYNMLLSSIDIAVMAHNRQQAMGNIISLIGNGATVFLSPRVSTWELCEQLALKVKALPELPLLQKINQTDVERNIKVVTDRFSRKKLIDEWSKIFQN